jgi:hypothetical protein
MGDTYEDVGCPQARTNPRVGLDGRVRLGGMALALSAGRATDMSEKCSQRRPRAKDRVSGRTAAKE